MAMDVTVPENATWVTDLASPGPLSGAVTPLEINTLSDLVRIGMVDSDRTLSRMIEAGKQVTATALTNVGTFKPIVNVPGTRRFDLKRFGDFLTKTSGEHPQTVSTFWRIFRKIEPDRVQNISGNTELKACGICAAEMVSNSKNWASANVKDITVENNATLELGKTIKVVTAHNILIKNKGKIIVKSSSIHITAQSIKGIQ